MSVLSKSVAQFSVDLLGQVSSPESDVFLSPVSIAVALGMTYAGAQGNTAKQMKETLFKGFTDDPAIHTGFAEIVKALNQPSQSYQLNTANRLYCQKDFEIFDQFLSTLASHYQSDVKCVDFVRDTENTRKGSFTNYVTLTGVDMMSQTGEFLYGKSECVQVLGMPYLSDLVMFVLLPKERFGLEDFQKQLTGTQLLSLISHTVEMEVIVRMPRFCLEQSFSLNGALKELGMTDMFTPDANFSKITGDKDFLISAVVHKAFIEVNEAGSEAAAATGFSPYECCARIQPEFVADHPFLFIIVDMRTKAVVFLGKAAALS